MPDFHKQLISGKEGRGQTYVQLGADPSETSRERYELMTDKAAHNPSGEQEKIL